MVEEDVLGNGETKKKTEQIKLRRYVANVRELREDSPSYSFAVTYGYEDTGIGPGSYEKKFLVTYVPVDGREKLEKKEEEIANSAVRKALEVKLGAEQVARSSGNADLLDISFKKQVVAGDLQIGIRMLDSPSSSQ